MMSFIKQSWLVLALAIGAGVALAAVESRLAPTIAEQQKKKTERAIALVTVGPQADPGALRIDSVPIAGMDVYKVYGTDGRTAGWAVPATGKGYGGPIKLMIGLSPDGQTIKAIEVISASETPGLGDKIRGQDFRGEFEAAPADGSLEVVKAGGGPAAQVTAISGATISSKAVVNAVNDRLRQVQPAIVVSAGGMGQ